MPNLEQTGLLRIRYRDLTEVAADADAWAGCHFALRDDSSQHRSEVAAALLDELRRNLAIDVEALSEEGFDRIRRLSAQHLKEPWSLPERELPPMAGVAFAGPGKRGLPRNNVFLSGRGMFGRFLIREYASQKVTLTTGEELEQIVVGVHDGRPVYLRDVRKPDPGPQEADDYVLFGKGKAEGGGGEYPAVTITLAKRKGTNASTIAERVEETLATLRGQLLPSDLNVTITRNYGETATEKSRELLLHILIATLGVALLVWLTLGWREAVVVLVAVPVTLALTLLVYRLYGYTLNRITLFALVFAIGILVDDAIVVVENIARHLRLGQRHADEAAVMAVDEVGNPTILATLTVIAAILPGAGTDEALAHVFLCDSGSVAVEVALKRDVGESEELDPVSCRHATSSEGSRAVL